MVSFVPYLEPQMAPQLSPQLSFLEDLPLLGLLKKWHRSQQWLQNFQALPNTPWWYIWRGSIHACMSWPICLKIHCVVDTYTPCSQIFPVLLSPRFGKRLGSTSGCCNLSGNCHHHISFQQGRSTYSVQAVVSVLHAFTHLIPTTPVRGRPSPLQR